MYRLLSILFLSILIGAASCNDIPDHARYIPKSAIMVAGIHVNKIGKKLAWDALLGSELIRKMKEKSKDSSGFMNKLKASGIDGMATYYAYTLSNNTDAPDKITALLPLDDAEAWAGFIKKEFPDTEIEQKSSAYKEAMLADGMYAGWNDDLLIVIKMLDIPVDTGHVDIFYGNAMRDKAAFSSDMAAAFNIMKENSILKNKKFTSMEEDRHDIVYWINFEEVAQNRSNQIRAATGGLPVSNNLWKDAVLAGGLNFNDGIVEGDMRLYVSDELEDAGKELGKESLDKEVLRHLPFKNNNVLFASHLSPKGLKMMLEKTGLLGFLNLALAAQKLHTDYVMEAFTGDIALSVNNLSVQMVTDSFSGISEEKMQMDYVLAARIGKKETLNRLLQTGVQNGKILKTGNDSYITTDTSKKIFILNDRYITYSNNKAAAMAYLNRTQEDEIPENASDMLNDPFALYVDAGSFNKKMAATGRDTALKRTQRKKITDIMRYVSLSGGRFSNNAFNYKLKIGLADEDENSLLQILFFADQMKKQRPTEDDTDF